MLCGSGAAGAPQQSGAMPKRSGMMPSCQPSGGIPVPPGGAFAASGVLVGKDANYDGRIEQNEMGFIATGSVINGGGGGGDVDCSDCVRTVTTYKDVQVPCTRNRYKVVNYTVPQTVPYTEYETVTKTRTVVKPMPKTILVPVKVEQPYQEQVPVTKYKTIQVSKSRTECSPHTTIVKRRIPVVNVIPNPPPPCPAPVDPCEPCGNDPTPLPEPLPQPRYQ